MPRTSNRRSGLIEGLEGRTLFAGTPAELITQALDRVSDEATQKLLDRARVAPADASQTAFSEFDSVDSKGIETFAQVLITKDYVNPSASSASLSLAVRDTTTSTNLLGAFGTTPLTGGTTARFDDLSRATSAGTIVGTDITSLESFSTSFAVQWKGTGKTTSSHTVDVQNDIVTITLNQTRSATATGQLTSPGTTQTPLSGNLTPAAATLASLDSTVTYQLSLSAAQKLFGPWIRDSDRGHCGPVEYRGHSWDRMTTITGKLSDLDGAARRRLASDLLSKLSGKNA